MSVEKEAEFGHAICGSLRSLQLIQNAGAEQYGAASGTPSDSVTKSVDSVIKPTDSVTKPTDSVTKPADSVTKPTDSVTKPTDSVTKPTDSVTETYR